MPRTGLDVRDTEIKPSFRPHESCPVVLPGDALRALGTKKIGGRVDTVSPWDQRTDQVLALT